LINVAIINKPLARTNGAVYKLRYQYSSIFKLVNYLMDADKKNK